MGELTLGTEGYVAFKRHSFAVAQMAFPEKGGSSGLDAVRWPGSNTVTVQSPPTASAGRPARDYVPGWVSFQGFWELSLFCLSRPLTCEVHAFSALSYFYKVT